MVSLANSTGVSLISTTVHKLKTPGRLSSLPLLLSFQSGEPTVSVGITSILLSISSKQKAEVLTESLELERLKGMRINQPEQWLRRKSRRDKPHQRDLHLIRQPSCHCHGPRRSCRLTADVQYRSPGLWWSLPPDAASPSQRKLHHPPTEAGKPLPVSLALLKYCSANQWILVDVLIQVKVFLNGSVKCIFLDIYLKNKI